MTTGETPQQEQNLAERLRAELEFVLDETGEWLVNDDLESVNGINGPEWLPARVRVSATGESLEFGVNKVDLEKYLELGRISGEPSQDVDNVRRFWPEDSRIRVAEDEEWLFMGASIEPTAESFEQEYGNIIGGINVAMTGALKGKSYEELKADKWFGTWVTGAESIAEGGGRSAIFPIQSEIHEEDEDDLGTNDEEETDSGCPDYWDRSAENLHGYSIETWDKTVGEAATELRLGDKVFIGTGIGHLGRRVYKDERGSVVSIYDSGYEFDDATDEHGEDKRWHAELAIGDAEVKTVADMAKLTHLSLKLENEDRSEKDPETTLELPVSVTTEDHKLIIESEDGEVGIVFYEPACMRCETPIWKFQENLAKRPSNKASAGMGFGGDIIMQGGQGTSGGVEHHSIGKYEYGKRKNVCCQNCFDAIRDEFVTEFPLARKENALVAFRTKLDELGYSDVQLEPTYMFPSMFHHDGDIEIFAYVEYERNGRKIMRRAGVPTLTYDGKITPNMPSREYVDFR